MIERKIILVKKERKRNDRIFIKKSGRRNHGTTMTVVEWNSTVL